MKKNTLCSLDGNDAAAYIAHRTNEICIIYPITPATSMGELADQQTTAQVCNVWGTVPEIVTMQSEGGVAGAIHGALQTGALVTTFTSSQGLLLMIPNMYRIAAELTPTVIHVATRTLAYQAMSVYCDHSDVMATRATGFAMLCSANVQEAHDMALLTQAASLKSNLPFLHFFDGFRTSHEINKIELLSDEQILATIDDDLILNYRQRRLTSDHPTARGVVQDADTFFQSREISNPFYAALPEILEELFKKFQQLTGRAYNLVEYIGDPDAESIIILMGSGAETATETVEYLNKHGAKTAVIKIRLFLPFPQKQLIAAIPQSCKAIAVLDRTKESGAAGEPIYQAVTTTLFEHYTANQKTSYKLPKIIAGHYGLAGKEFTPTMVKAVFDNLASPNPKNHFTIGINDDVTHTSLDYAKDFDIEPADTIRAIFYGLGADGTVSSNKNTIKIIGEETDLDVQGYFVYDAKKSGSRTFSYLRFGHNKIRSTYLINQANFIGCHQFNFIERMPILERAAHGATLLLNSPYSADKIWDKLPMSTQQTIIAKNITFYVIDAYRVAQEAGTGGYTNTIMQTCFFALSKVLPLEKAINKIKAAISKTYASKGADLLAKNFAAVDNAIINLQQVHTPDTVTNTVDIPPPISNLAPEFVRNVIGKMLAGQGDDLPVSAIPVDGTYPTNTTHWEKRGMSVNTAVWNPNTCIQCNRCSLVCPHAVIRVKQFPEHLLTNAPETFKSCKSKDPKAQGECFALHIYAENCTGCGACVFNCPITKNSNIDNALTMQSKTLLIDNNEQTNNDFFESLPTIDALDVDKTTAKGLQYAAPMFEFCAACAGCGEAPYVKLLTQLLGDRLIIANACGCSIVFGGYLPTTPWTVNQEGRGPAYSSSLFEDNAEYGFGMLLGIEKHRQQALELLQLLSPAINDPQLITELTQNLQRTDQEITKQRQLVAILKQKLATIKHPQTKQLLSLADQLVKHSVWTIGGDGWAYDIGFGGVDHVLASGRNTKILLLDTEVYSNTGGQSSKATPRGAVAKFATNGKPTAKKDLGLMMMTYGNIYVATIALGANPNQALKALQEAENYNGPALIIAYSHCISHGIDMSQGMRQQQLAVQSGYWPLYRYNPDRSQIQQSPFQLDSGKPSIPLREYLDNENRFRSLFRQHPETAEQIIAQAEEDIRKRWQQYEALLGAVESK